MISHHVNISVQEKPWVKGSQAMVGRLELKFIILVREYHDGGSRHLQI